MIEKRAILGALRRQLEDEIETMARLERHYRDMQDVEELSTALASLGAMQLKTCKAVEVSALVELRHKNIKTLCFVVPAAGGRKVRLDDVEITAVTTSTPLGEAIDGLGAGDEAEVETPAGAKIYEVLSVR